MFKYLIIFCLVGLMLVYAGNYFDYQRQKISRKEYDRRTRFFILLVFLCIAIVVYLKKK
jgi:cell division protein FtsW (lipid II flippase)